MVWPFTKTTRLAEFLENNSSSTDVGLASPYTPRSDTLMKVIWSEVFSGATDIVTRETALQVPPVSRALGLIQGTLADLPLVADRGGAALDTQPTFLQRTDGSLSPWHRMANTIESLFFNGCALWIVERGAAGQITRADHCPDSMWSINDGKILVNNQRIDEKNVIFFIGPNRGLLNTAPMTIRGSRAIEQAWVGRVQSPIPVTVLRESVENSNLTADEIKQVVNDWVESRKSPNGATGFVPYGLELETHNGTDDQSLFTEGRNNVRLDIANFANIPASLLDGSTATASLTYTTAEGQKSSFHEQTLRFWMAPIEHRLSQDDVVPSGQRVRFDVQFIDNSPQEVTND